MKRKHGWENIAPMMITAEGSSSVDAMRESRHAPAGGRSVEKAADTMAAGLQPTRKKLPQLLPDGLTPEVHLQAAMKVQHPLTYAPSITEAVKYALKFACENVTQTLEKRRAVAATVRQLAEACADENDRLLSLCAPSVATVLRAFGVKNVVLMRELAFTCRSLDISSPAYLLIGLPMMGWARGAEGLMRRLKPPNCSIEEFLQTKDDRNSKILRSTKASSDPKLDEESYKKTLAEVDRGVLQGPFESLDAVPFRNVALVPRHGIWEQHGGATEQSCRNNRRHAGWREQ